MGFVASPVADVSVVTIFASSPGYRYITPVTSTPRLMPRVNAATYGDGAMCSSSRWWRIPVEARDSEEETTVRLSRVNRHEFAGVVEGVTASDNTHDVAADLN